MHNKAFFKKLITSIMAFGLIASLCACSGSNTSVTKRSLTSEELESQAAKNNDAKVRKSIKDFLGFEIGAEYIDDAELMLDVTNTKSRGSICILVVQGKEEDLLKLLQKNIGIENNIGPNVIPAELNNQYAEDLRKMSPIKQWILSDSVSVYMGRDGAYSFLYIFA